MTLARTAALFVLAALPVLAAGDDLVVRLGSSDPAVRHTAVREAQAMGDAAVPQLWAALLASAALPPEDAAFDAPAVLLLDRHAASPDTVGRALASAKASAPAQGIALLRLGRASAASGFKSHAPSALAARQDARLFLNAALQSTPATTAGHAVLAREALTTLLAVAGTDKDAAGKGWARRLIDLDPRDARP